MNEIPIKDQKKGLRLAIRAISDGRPDGSELICRNVIDSYEYAGAQCVLAFCGVGSEPDTIQLIGHALRAGKRLLLPLCVSKAEMQARVVRSLDELVRGMYGILEPPSDSDIALPEDIDLILVPGLCFDRSGYRLGHGAGYYDRYLAKSKCKTIGLCFESQLHGSIPHEDNDLPVNAIATENALLRI